MSIFKLLFTGSLLSIAFPSLGQYVEEQEPSNKKGGNLDFAISVGGVFHSLKLNVPSFSYRFEDDLGNYLMEGEGTMPQEKFMLGFELSSIYYFKQRYTAEPRLQVMFTSDGTPVYNVSLGGGYMFHLSSDKVENMPKSWLEVGAHYTYFTLNREIDKIYVNANQPDMELNGRQLSLDDDRVNRYQMDVMMVSHFVSPYVQLNHFFGKQIAVYARMRFGFQVASEINGSMLYYGDENSTGRRHFPYEYINITHDGQSVQGFVFQPGITSFSLGVTWMFAREQNP